MRSLLSLCRAGLSRHPMAGTLGALLLSAATADAQNVRSRFSIQPQTVQPGKRMIDKKFQPASLNAERVQVMVELEDEPAIKVYSRARRVDHMTEAAARDLSEHQALSLRRKHNKLKKRMAKADIDAKFLYNVQHAYNGIAVYVHPGNIERIRALGGVKDVHGMHPKQRTANSSVNFINTPSFWNTVANGGLNLHGEGIKIGDIDTGIDYVHRDFGGSGSAEDYLKAIANSTQPTVPGLYPNSIVVGGYDFAGDDYNADDTAASYNPVPSPDPNPFDSPDPASTGHGTSTASITSGRGVSADGSTFPGPYDSSVPLGSQIIGPGIAPASSLYVYRVFGNEGSTDLVVQAIDRGVIDKVDVLNLSLGSDFAGGDDPDAVAMDNASEAGVICVAAAGNAGDTYFITGSPAASLRGISVAASYNDNLLIPTLTGVAPAAIAGKQFVLTSGTDGPAVTQPIPAQDVVYALPHIGKPFDPTKDTAFPDLDNAAAIKGHIAIIDRGTYSFYIKVAECEKAGATAVIIANNQPGSISPITSGPGPNGTTYVPKVPNGAISQDDGKAIEDTLDKVNGTDTGTQLAFVATNGADTVPAYTSRGPRSPDGLLKPDITAPAEAVNVAAHLTGTGTESFNGTSSATPHVAGAMALLKQLHPTWTVEQLKALVMNTADHDIFAAAGESGTKIGPGRVGNGRIDLTPASKASVIAYNADLPGAVSVSFGPVDVPIDATNFSRSHTINVVNKGATAQTFNVSFVSTGTDVPGVTFSVPASVTVPAATSGGDGLVPLAVTMNAVPTSLLHTHDPSIAATQGGVLRDYKSEATGYVQLTPTGVSGTPIRVVVHAMPRPVSTAHAASAALALPGASGNVTIPFTGAAVENGTTPPVGIFGLLKVLELQYIGVSAFNHGTFADSANIQYVGIHSDYAAEGNSLPDTVFNFGIAAYADHASPTAFDTDFDVLIDTSGGSTFTPNYIVFNFLLGSATAREDVYVPMIINLKTGATTARYFTNGFSANTGFDTNIYNTNVFTYPVMASDLGMTASSNPVIHYQVVGSYEGVPISATSVLTYDPTHPGLVDGAQEPTINDDLGADQATFEPVTLAYNNANLLANHSLGVLALHLHNASGARADAILTATPAITGFTPASGPVGSTVTFTGTGLGGATSVTFFNKKAANFTVNAAGTSLTATVPAGATTGTVVITTPTGKATTAKKFVVTPP